MAGAPLPKVKPVFLRNSDIPHVQEQRPTVLEICRAAEDVTGRFTIFGAQPLGGNWRIYPDNEEARRLLQVRGMCIRGVNIQVTAQNSNPLLNNDVDVDKPFTKVWIDNVPISVAGSEFEDMLKSAGCELRSSMLFEKARDNDGKLTRYHTGRRFILISVPDTPLSSMYKVAGYNAKVYHKEQKEQRRKTVCSNCLQDNHHRSRCTNPVVCHVCKQPGHKSGSPECHGTDGWETDSGEIGEKHAEAAEAAGDATDLPLPSPLRSRSPSPSSTTPHPASTPTPTPETPGDSSEATPPGDTDTDHAEDTGVTDEVEAGEAAGETADTAVRSTGRKKVKSTPGRLTKRQKERQTSLMAAGYTKNRSQSVKRSASQRSASPARGDRAKQKKTDSAGDISDPDSCHGGGNGGVGGGLESTDTRL